MVQAIHEHSYRYERPLIVGISGPDCSGKTRLTTELEELCVGLNISSSTIHIDNFHRPKVLRYDNRLPEHLQYYLRSFDYDPLIESVLEPCFTSGRVDETLHHIDLATDSRINVQQYSIERETVVFLEGVFLGRPTLKPYLDLHVELAVEEAVLLHRALGRDASVLGDDLESRYMRKYLRAQRLYRRICTPLATADIVIENSDLENPVLVRPQNFEAVARVAPSWYTRPMNTSLKDVVPAGVLTGDDVSRLFAHAKAHGYAIPAANVIGTNSTNAALEAASAAQAPVIIQFSNGGALFNAGKSLDPLAGSIAGAVAGALHVRTVAESYGIPIVLHTDHAAEPLLPWIDGLLDEGELYFQNYGEPLFSSHMLDLSEMTLDENLRICSLYMERMDRLGMTLELELGITGGEEDGVDNSDVDPEKLYSTPSDVEAAVRQIGALSNRYTIAAAFGNVHGVYKPGNVQLRPEILKAAQDHVSKIFDDVGEKSVNFVFHGGSGSSRADISAAISYGVVKMNIDTDLQWAFWDGVRAYCAQNEGYLQSQIGNPESPDAPNKKTYDPRSWLRQGEVSFRDRLILAFEELGTVGMYA